MAVDAYSRNVKKTERRLKRLRRLARLSLFIESLSKALFPLFCWIGGFISFWLLEGQTIFGSGAETLFFLLFVIGGLLCLRHALRNIETADTETLDRRIERFNNLQHRPIETISDHIANLGSTNEDQDNKKTLWQRHQISALHALRRISAPPPKPVLAKTDQYALRFLLLFFLIIGFYHAGPTWPERIIRGITPLDLTQRITGTRTAAFWITPPTYTGVGRMNIALATDGSKTITSNLAIPQGSEIEARITGGFFTPHLVLRTNDATQDKQTGRVEKERLSFTSQGKKSWSHKGIITDANRMEIHRGMKMLAVIPYTFIPDTPPAIKLSGNITTDDKAKLRIPITVEDDYGVKDIDIHITLSPDIKDASPLGTDVNDTRLIMSAAGAEFDTSIQLSLGWHPWAGLPVNITLTAKDHIGQETVLKDVHAVLPERVFTNPTAKKVIEARQKLIWSMNMYPAQVITMLQDRLNFPARYNYDPVVTLALRSAIGRLRYNFTKQDHLTVIELLWDTAQRIEDGDLDQAEGNVRAAQKKLEDLLNDPNASDEEIAQAMQELQSAMLEYMMEMARDMLQDMDSLTPEMQEMLKNMQHDMDTGSMQSFLEQLRNEALSGDRKSAQQMLSELQRFMDNMSSSSKMQMPEDMTFMMKGISALQQLIEQQEKLRDQTVIQAEDQDKDKQRIKQYYPEAIPFLDDDLPPPPGQDDDVLLDFGELPPTPDTEEQSKTVFTEKNAVEQDAIRYALGQLMLEANEKLNEIPEGMQKAELEMRSSATALRDNDPLRSVPHQDRAIEYLKESMESMSQKLSQGMQQMVMLPFGSRQTDPLGRPLGENGNSPFAPDSTVKIPDEAKRKSVEDILRTLRDKSGEFNRPTYELEYFRRLLKQF